MEASLKTPAVTAISAGRRRLGALLVADGLVSQHQIEAALARQQIERRRLGDVLVREGLVSEADLVEALAAQLRLEVADLDQVYFSPETLALLPRDFMVNRRVLPLEVEDDGTLVLAMTDPLDIVAIDEVRLRTKRNVRPVICTESAFEEASATFFNTRGKLRELSEEEESLVADEAALAHDASIIEIVDGLISDAVSMKASDIHVEPHAEALHVRCRIDGVLHKLREFPTEVQAGIVSRIKIMGNMDIAERRMPQDGRTSFETSSGKAVDLRLASIPTLHGENVSIRILEVSPLPPTLDSLGLTGPSLERFEEAIRRPEGGILICGPTGCGKSTTLYTTLELIKSPESKIYTVEDPIERKLEGVMQSEVKAGHRPRLRRPAAHPAAQRPRPHHGGGDQGRGDRPHGGRGRHDRAPGVLDAAHARRRLGRAPPGRDGPAAVSGRRGLHLRRLAAARAPPLPALPQAEDRARERLGEARPGRGAAAPDEGLRRRRLHALLRHRLPGASRASSRCSRWTRRWPT